MGVYDWIIVGNGLTGAGLSYELAKAGCSVLVIDRQPGLWNATRCSYGGVPYWSGATDLLRTSFRESMARYATLAKELEVDFQFRHLDLLLYLPPDADATAIAQQYSRVDTPPHFIDAKTAAEMEPLLNPDAIAGALTVRHAHVHPLRLLEAYQAAGSRLGNQEVFAEVVAFETQGDRTTGVVTENETFHANNVCICAGGFSRSLLKLLGLPIPTYFSHAEVITTSPSPVQLSTALMPAVYQRPKLESAATDPDKLPQWQELNQEIMPPILDAGVFQFADNCLRIGQVSRIFTAPKTPADPAASEQKIRQAIALLLPSLADCPGQWRHCLVGFNADGLPLVGAVPGQEGLWMFSGFSAPFGLMPAIAQRFAKRVTQLNPATDSVLAQITPDRFLSS